MQILESPWILSLIMNLTFEKAGIMHTWDSAEDHSFKEKNEAKSNNYIIPMNNGGSGNWTQRSRMVCRVSLRGRNIVMRWLCTYDPLKDKTRGCRDISIQLQY